MQRRGSLFGEDKRPQHQGSKVRDRKASPDDPGERRYNLQGRPPEGGNRETSPGNHGSYEGKG
ncbi:MAG: hypothetical protein JOZ19_02455 [Rubrobacter sp.]|nr:hypothetical protein [Rubrobacter sp.]